MAEYYDLEKNCEFNFAKAERELGPFWHISTPGDGVEALNICKEDFIFNVSNSAISAAESGIVIITDSIMETHIHNLAGGSLEQCYLFIDNYRDRMARYFKSTGRDVDLNKFACENPIPIKDLKTLRNEIVYINRNGYVDNPRYLPFSYPWGAGSYYFNPYAIMDKGVPYNELSFREKRQLCRSRVAALSDNLRVLNGMILPSSYAKIALGESMFRNAHHYFNLLSKNYEAYSESAKRAGETISVTREELYSIIRMLSNQMFKIKQPSLLPPESKIEIARILHSDYNASNKFIRSALKLDENVVNSLFPLASNSIW